MAETTRVEASSENLEEAVFKTLSNQKRRDIIRLLGENTDATFTEIKHSTGEDSPSLSYHLSALDKLIIQNEGMYRLSELGQEAYKLMNKIIASTLSTSKIKSAQKWIFAMILVNSLLWISAMVSASAFSATQGTLNNMMFFSFSALWLISNIALYSISKKLQ
jgi:DNA-binding transcriptional ArsR family regulator